MMHTHRLDTQDDRWRNGHVTVKTTPRPMQEPPEAPLSTLAEMLEDAKGIRKRSRQNCVPNFGIPGKNCGKPTEEALARREQVFNFIRDNGQTKYGDIAARFNTKEDPNVAKNDVDKLRQQRRIRNVSKGVYEVTPTEQAE